MSENAPPSIAVLQIGRLGDMILTTPLFTGLKKIYPGAALTVIADEGAAIIPAHHHAVNDVVEVRRGILKIPQLARQLLKGGYDLYIDPKDHRSTTSRLLAGMIRADRAFMHPANAVGTKGILPLEPPTGTPHYVDVMLGPLRRIAPEQTFSRRPTIDIPSDTLRRIDERINPGVAGLIVVNISAGHPSRYWKAEKWKEVIATLTEDYEIAIISSPADRALADEICTTRRAARTAATASILEAAAVVARSVAVISPDTSIIHLASAFNKPTVGLYPPIDWNAARFAPLADRHRILLPAEGETVADIATERVIEGLRELL